MGRKNYVPPVSRPLQALQPAPPAPVPEITIKPLEPPPPQVTFYDLPAEIRVQIYKLALQNVIVHVIPCNAVEGYAQKNARSCPHALLRTSKLIRGEVMPIMQETCPIRATVTDFDFGGLLTWLWRIPPNHLHGLTKNPRLGITLCTTTRARGDLPTLRRWLHDRADPCRPQPDWRYSGPTPQDKIASDLRRRLRRMKEKNKAAELRKMLGAIGVNAPPPKDDNEPMST